MGNMSYCRFRNTLGDLRDCQEAIDEPCSKDEAYARAELIKLCLQIASDFSDEDSINDLPVDGENTED